MQKRTGTGRFIKWPEEEGSGSLVPSYNSSLIRAVEDPSGGSELTSCHPQADKFQSHLLNRPYAPACLFKGARDLIMPGRRHNAITILHFK